MAITPEQARAELARRKASASSTATSTPAITPAQAKAELERRKIANTPEPGFVQGLAQSVVKPFARFGASGLNVLQGGVATVAGLTHLNDPTALAKDTAILNGLKNKEYDLGYFGKVKGIGGTGTLGGDVKDAAGVALETAANIIPVGKIAPLVKATVAGRILQGSKIGATTGLHSGLLGGAGTELQNQDSTIGSVAKSSALSGVTGLASGGVLGGVLPLPVATALGTKTALDPSTIMNRVARVNPTQANKFNKMAGEDIGKYLTTRGIYGNDEQIIKQLADRFQTSRNLADTEIAKLGGEFKSEPVSVALNQLAERESRVSVSGALSKDFARVNELVRKNQKSGLTMQEINEVKRLFERNVKTGYLRENNSDKIALATNIDSRLREWQLEQAKKLGLNNLDEINKETQLARELGDSLYKKSLGQGGNNALGLGDLLLLSGGDPQAIAMFTSRKVFGNKTIQSSIAKTLAGKPTVGLPTAKTRTPVSDIGRLLEAGDGKTTNAIPLPRANDVPLTPAQIQANNALQNSRIQNTRLALPAGDGKTSYINNGAPIPLRTAPTVEAPAKTIRTYSGLNQANTPTITPSNISKNIIPTLPPNLKKSSAISTPLSQKLTQDIKLKVAKELESYDSTPLKVNGKIDLSNSDIEFRLDELKAKNANGTFTDKDAIEAQSLLKQMGIDVTK